MKEAEHETVSLIGTSDGDNFCHELCRHSPLEVEKIITLSLPSFPVSLGLCTEKKSGTCIWVTFFLYVMIIGQLSQWT